LVSSRVYPPLHSWYVPASRHWKRRLRERRRPPKCYTRKDRDLEREARRITESNLKEEEARHRHEEHRRRREQEEKKPLTEKVKEVIGVR
jgi:hypothetical protein